MYPNALTTIDPRYLLNEKRLAKIRTRLYAASKLGFTLNYIISGDSTRAVPLEVLYGTFEYYKYLLNKLNVSVYLNAMPGMDSVEWLSGSLVTVTQAQAVGEISGTGGNSILEFSFGLNDWVARNGDYALTKADLKAGIQSIITAKPDTAILLVSPVKMNEPVAARRRSLAQIYSELAEEMDLPLIDGYAATKDVYNLPLYYADYAGSPHLAEFGGKRLVNYIIDRIVPETIRNSITYDDFKAPELNYSNVPVITDKLYSGGEQSASVGGRCLNPIKCKGATMLTISHQGNARAVHCKDSSGVFISSQVIDSVVVPNRKLFLPYNTDSVGINIANTGAAYDALNDKISITFSYMSQDAINRGLDRLPYYSF